MPRDLSKDEGEDHLNELRTALWTAELATTVCEIAFGDSWKKIMATPAFQSALVNHVKLLESQGLTRALRKELFEQYNRSEVTLQAMRWPKGEGVALQIKVYLDDPEHYHDERRTEPPRTEGDPDDPSPY
jgi:hypothetical protein